MTLTALPDEPAPDPLARTAEEQADHDERRAVRGYHTAHTDSTLVLDAIFCMAASHDTLTQYYEDKIYRQLGLRGEASGETGDSALNDYVFTAIELCAAIAPAAIRRIPAPVFVKAVARSGEIQSLGGEELEAFMRPIFEESGIGERFEVRTGYQVYRRYELQPN